MTLALDKVGHLALDRHPEAVPAGRVGDGADRQLGMEGRAILGVVLDDLADGLPGRERRADAVHHLAAGIGPLQDAGRLADDLLARVAGQAGEGRVAPQDAPPRRALRLGFGDEDGVGGVIADIGDQGVEVYGRKCPVGRNRNETDLLAPKFPAGFRPARDACRNPSNARHRPLRSARAAASLGAGQSGRTRWPRDCARACRRARCWRAPS